MAKLAVTLMLAVTLVSVRGSVGAVVAPLHEVVAGVGDRGDGGAVAAVGRRSAGVVPLIVPWAPAV